MIAPDGRHIAVVEGYSSDPGLLTGSVTIVDLASGTARDPWPDLETVGRVAWAGPDRLWYARYAGTHTASGSCGWTDAARSAGRAMRSSAPTSPSRRSRSWPTARCSRPTRRTAWRPRWPVSTRPPAPGPVSPGSTTPSRGPDVPRRARGALDRSRRRHGDRGAPAHAARQHRPLADDRGRPRWSDVELERLFLGLGAQRGAACRRGLRRPAAQSPGSSGRGHAFAEQLLGDPGGIDLRDIMAGVDWCVQQGIADPSRLGICGLSYGGYMAGWAVTKTDRFKASVAISVVADFRSFHLTSEVAAWAQSILRGRLGRHRRAI